MDETETKRKEAYERPERVNHGRHPPILVTASYLPTAEEEQPRPETGGQESRIRRPAFNIELWEVPAHIEAIPEAARQGHQDYEDWKEDRGAEETSRIIPQDSNTSSLISR